MKHPHGIGPLVFLMAAAATAALPPVSMKDMIARHAEVYDVRVIEIHAEAQRPGDTAVTAQEFTGRIEAVVKGPRAPSEALRFETYRIDDSPALRALRRNPMPGPAPDRGPGLVQVGQQVRLFLKATPMTEPLPISRIAGPDAASIPR